MKPTKSHVTPVVDLADKDRVREQIKSLKAGERLNVQNGDYVLTVGVPSIEEDEAATATTEISPDETSWFD